MINNQKDQYRHSRFTGLFASKFFVWFLFTLSVIACLLIISGNIRQQVISVSFDSSNSESNTSFDTLTYECFLNGESFELKWIHSVEKQWWVEAYQLQGNTLLLTDTYFETFGAGTPSTEHTDTQASKNLQSDTIYQARQQELNTRYDGYVHYQINTELKELNWMISANIQAVIINQNHTIPIYQWVDDYTNIHIAPKTVRLWELMSQESCHDDTDTAHLRHTAATGSNTTF